MFHILLNLFSFKFNVIRNDININNDFNYEIIILKLQKKKI